MHLPVSLPPFCREHPLGGRRSRTEGGCHPTQGGGAMKTVWIGAAAIALFGSATVGWAVPIAPAPEPAVAASASPLLLIRHHRHHGHWRHGRSRWLDEREPEAAMPEPPSGTAIIGSEQPPMSARPPAAAAPSSTPNRAGHHSGSSKPAIRWVDPEKSGR